MGLLDPLKKMSSAAGQSKVFTDIQKSINNYQDKKQAIADGNIEPIQVSARLRTNEKAFAEFQAKRVVLVKESVNRTVTKSKKKGVLTRAVSGGLLMKPFGLGRFGALGGAATAGSKSISTTRQQDVSKLKTIDKGSIIMTNQRILFIGKEAVSLPYDELVAVNFRATISGVVMSVKYTGMLKDERYVLSGDDARKAGLYYKGIVGKMITQ